MKSTFAIVTMLVLPAAVHAQILYGVTATELVTINLGTGSTTAVGSLGLAANIIPGTLAWHPGQQALYGIAYQFSGLTVTDQLFLRINPATGVATTVATFGPQSGVVYDGLDYVDSLGNLVVARGPGGGDTRSTGLATLSTSGVVGGLVSTTLDNDILAYDAGRDTLYSLDPNTVGQFQKVNIRTGAHASLGAEPDATTGEMAYSTGTDRLYALNYALGTSVSHDLYVVNTHGGVGPAELEATLTLSGGQVQGIAFAPVPEPTGWAVLSGLGLGLWALARRRR